jgi:cell fate regulator YaaT (PSP1 superfamily)
MEREITMTENMTTIVGVRFRGNWKVYDFDAAGVEASIGDRLIVDTDRGPELASVVRLKKTPAPPGAEPVRQEHGLQIEEEDGEKTPQESGPRRNGESSGPPRKVIRKADSEDLAREEKNKEREAEAFRMAQDMIAERELPMRLIRVEYSLDAARVTFFFFSESRVDFRELVKDFAHKLRSRIEMRQIGVRDVARMIGGFGSCGRELCCSAFLKNFEPVSIRMAKKQEMVLNPAKISGVCGRLLCCLSYEYGMYDEIKKDAIGMREVAAREKREEEERRLAGARMDTDERRTAEEEKRRQPESRSEKQREGTKGGGRPEKKKEGQRQPARPQRETPPQPGKPRQEQQPKAAPAAADKTGKKKKRRFWRKKKTGQPGGEGKPQGPANP